MNIPADYSRVSVVMPAKNEAASLEELIGELKTHLPGIDILLVNDGSNDDTAAIAEANGATVISHPYSLGNGAAVKTGARNANGEILVFMDADSQHQPGDITRLLEALNNGYDMAVGSRDPRGQSSRMRALANFIYNKLASWITGHKVDDLTSGYRAVSAEKFKEFLYMLPNGFSYPTTITMAFFRAGYTVCYTPITTKTRQGTSHIMPLKDGLRFFLIIFKIGTLYSPLKIFFPASFAFFATGIGYYLYTFIMHHKFTNMGALLLSVSALVFLIGLISEQITVLMYKSNK